jgi:DNA-binding Xre family transcriptional regulator
MAQSTVLIDALKRELKARNITYADLAPVLELSEASVKRMFSKEDFTLKRLDTICEFAGIELDALARALGNRDEPITELTLRQEEELVASPKLFIMAVLALNLLTFEVIMQRYQFTEADAIKLLLKLEKLKFLELRPGNRIKLTIARNFSWIPDGPIQRLFKEDAAYDFFDSDFDQAHELMVFLNGMLSESSINGLMDRLKRVARQFNDDHLSDSTRSWDDRHAVSLLLAVRPWIPRRFMPFLQPNTSPTPIVVRGKTKPNA